MNGLLNSAVEASTALRFTRDVLSHPVPLDHDFLAAAVDLLRGDAKQRAGAGQPHAVAFHPGIVGPVVFGHQALGEWQAVFRDVQIRAVLHAQVQVLHAQHRNQRSRGEMQANFLDFADRFVHGHPRDNRM